MENVSSSRLFSFLDLFTYLATWPTELSNLIGSIDLYGGHNAIVGAGLLGNQYSLGHFSNIYEKVYNHEASEQFPRVPEDHAFYGMRAYDVQDHWIDYGRAKGDRFVYHITQGSDINSNNSLGLRPEYHRYRFFTDIARISQMFSRILPFITRRDYEKLAFYLDMWERERYKLFGVFRQVFLSVSLVFFFDVEVYACLVIDSRCG
mgnify:CR=1 FL=1